MIPLCLGADERRSGTSFGHHVVTLVDVVGPSPTRHHSRWVSLALNGEDVRLAGLCGAFDWFGISIVLVEQVGTAVVPNVDGRGNAVSVVVDGGEIWNTGKCMWWLRSTKP